MRLNSLKRATRFLLSGVLLLVLTLTSAPVDVAADEVQLNQFTFRTPVGKKIVTVFLDTASNRGSKTVCSFAPRLRDQILGELSSRTPKLTATRDVDLVALQRQLLPLVRSQLPEGLINDIRIVHGAPKVSTNAAKSLSRLGCTVSER